MTPATIPCPSPAQHPWREALQALALAFGSGGWLWLRTVAAVYVVARAAPSHARSASTVLVPGHRLRDGEISPTFALRLERALRLWRAHPERRLLLSGGANPPDAPSEAHAGYAYLRDAGLPADADVVLDTCAHDSAANIGIAAGLLGAGGDPVVLVSNRWHLARCGWLARRHGLRWQLCAAESRWTGGPRAWLALASEGLILLGWAGREAARLDAAALLADGR